MQKRYSQIQFTQMAIAFGKAKEEIEKELSVKTITEMAAKRDIPVSVFRNLCKVNDIDCRKHANLGANGVQKGKIPPLLIQDILTVMGRICTELKIDGTEIKKYLN